MNTLKDMCEYIVNDMSQRDLMRFSVELREALVRGGSLTNVEMAIWESARAILRKENANPEK